MLEAKAAGYEQLLRVCGESKDLTPALLVIEKLPELIAEQVKAIQNLKIDKVTAWDSGRDNGNGDAGAGSTAGFLHGMIQALPPIHDLAEQAGIDLPSVLGSVKNADPSEAQPSSKPVRGGAEGTASG